MIQEELGAAIEQPLSIREQVYKLISELILSGKIAAGERIMENKIAQKLGVSRTPVREALHVLEMEGLLESIPRVGYQVREIVWEEVEDICEIRKVNEALAARWAMERITDKELKALQRNLEQVEADVKNGHPKRFIESDVDFHDIIVRASGSRRLIELCQTLRRHMLLYRIESVYDADMVMSAIEDHRQILESIKARDAEGVTNSVNGHLEHVKENVLHYAFELKKGRQPEGEKKPSRKG